MPAGWQTLCLARVATLAVALVAVAVPIGDAVVADGVVKQTIVRRAADRRQLCLVFVALAVGRSDDGTQRPGVERPLFFCTRLTNVSNVVPCSVRQSAGDFALLPPESERRVRKLPEEI